MDPYLDVLEPLPVVLHFAARHLNCYPEPKLDTAAHGRHTLDGEAEQFEIGVRVGSLHVCVANVQRSWPLRSYLKLLRCDGSVPTAR